MNDIILNSNFDPVLNNGDFVTNDSNAQEVALILKANQGEFRQFPTIGIGLNNHLNGSDLSRLKNDFESQINQIEGKSAKLTIGKDGSVAIEV